ncbi:MAG: thioredoxin domain-containing protein [Pirellulales bacterium]
MAFAAALFFTAGLEFAVRADEPGDKQEHPANRLAQESSLYLLLHAHNPVDWYPWGPEALQRAKQENKIIFLSIGYSSCHWCHVMERESFMDEEIAAFLNEHFVCIKVDREERPDIDDIYMTAVQVYYQATGQARGGGWPLSAFLTPDARPVFGGTYLPPRDVEGSIGFLTLIGKINDAWRDKPEDMQRSAGQLADLVKARLRRRPALMPRLPEARTLDELQAALADEFDADHGGFGYNEASQRQAKFPQASTLMFLLERVRRHDDAQALAMLTKTLSAIVAGGIRDHVGGGFHRYSTDRQWLVPHFEKMLYDNAQLATALAEAHAATGDAAYAAAAEETLAFLQREMADADGGFYAAIDAEADGDEGGYYTWTPDEVRAALPAADASQWIEAYGLAGRPNFEERYVLHLARPGPFSPEQSAALATSGRTLLEVREKRPRPRVDEKILTDWNGLAIRAFADAGRLLKKDEYTQSAARTAEFVLNKLRDNEGRLKHVYGRGQARLNAYLDDYAFLADGLIALHRATGDSRWLTAADELTELQLELFWDKDGGGFFFTSHDHEELLARGKSPVDSATPSGNSVTAGNLVYLAKALDKPDYLDRARQTVTAFTPLWEQAPAALPRMAVAVEALHAAKP